MIKRKDKVLKGFKTNLLLTVFHSSKLKEVGETCLGMLVTFKNFNYSVEPTGAIVIFTKETNSRY